MNTYCQRSHSLAEKRGEKREKLITIMHNVVPFLLYYVVYTKIKTVPHRYISSNVSNGKIAFLFHAE